MNSLRLLGVVVLFVLVGLGIVGGCGSSGGNGDGNGNGGDLAGEMNCTDMIDNDGDTQIDCDDIDCIMDPACNMPVVTGEMNCTDKIDNDGDTQIDCDDIDCLLDPACNMPVLSCQDIVNAACERVVECNAGLPFGDCLSALDMAIEGSGFGCEAHFNVPNAQECVADFDNLDCQELALASTPSCSPEGVCDICETDNDCIASQTCSECFADCTGVVDRCTGVLFASRCEDGVFFNFGPTITTPILLTPVNNAIIQQNNPNIGCPFNPTRGFGWRIFFDWTDASSPIGIRGYHLFVKSMTATIPIIDLFVLDSNFTDTSCNNFVIDANLNDWIWSVQAEDNFGNLSSVPTGEFMFGPCRLADGTPCNAP